MRRVKCLHLEAGRRMDSSSSSRLF